MKWIGGSAGASPAPRSTQAGTAAWGLLRELRGDGGKEAHFPTPFGSVLFVSKALLSWHTHLQEGDDCSASPSQRRNKTLAKYYFSYLPEIMLSISRMLIMGSGGSFNSGPNSQVITLNNSVSVGKGSNHLAEQRKATCIPEHPGPRGGQVRVSGISVFQFHTEGDLCTQRCNHRQKYISKCQTVQAGVHSRCLQLQLIRGCSPARGSHWPLGWRAQFGGQPTCDHCQLSCRCMFNGPVC